MRIKATTDFKPLHNALTFYLKRLKTYFWSDMFEILHSSYVRDKSFDHRRAESKPHSLAKFVVSQTMTEIRKY